ncbi:hypothetical protein [Paraburkholderia solisilvae]|uniref:hypothetical protein n=1 Tax=Paraburkholderia solisilvae TaxID=624376 RepID=UPI001581ED58|nr:hypothetical protein [Paraburkholderia solisilvae]
MLSADSQMKFRRQIISGSVSRDIGQTASSVRAQTRADTLARDRFPSPGHSASASPARLTLHGGDATLATLNMHRAL